MTTDACLPSAALGEAPLGARVLIHYDLPAKKVNYFFCSTWFILHCIMLNISDGSWLSRIGNLYPTSALPVYRKEMLDDGLL
jgi:hypothetical protein